MSKSREAGKQGFALHEFTVNWDTGCHLWIDHWSDFSGLQGVYQVVKAWLYMEAEIWPRAGLLNITFVRLTSYPPLER